VICLRMSATLEPEDELGFDFMACGVCRLGDRSRRQFSPDAIG
jgi:hypothetical protein